MDLNHRPPGYEPSEMPLLYPAIVLMCEFTDRIARGAFTRRALGVPLVYKLTHKLMNLTTGS